MTVTPSPGHITHCGVQSAVQININCVITQRAASPWIHAIEVLVVCVDGVWRGVHEHFSLSDTKKTGEIFFSTTTFSSCTTSRVCNTWRRATCFAVQHQLRRCTGCNILLLSKYWVLRGCRAAWGVLAFAGGGDKIQEK